MMQALTTLSGSVRNVCGWIFKHSKQAAVLSLVLFCSSFEAVNAVLPSYLPALGVAYRGRDSLVQQYYTVARKGHPNTGILFYTQNVTVDLVWVSATRDLDL